MEQSLCVICGREGELAFGERFDPALVNSFSYASRKAPELMHFEYLRCDTCRLLYSSKRVSADALEQAYKSAEFDASLESEYAAKTYRRLSSRFLRSGDSLLDVGCGDGAFLSECRDLGLNVLGIEPSDQAADGAEPTSSSLIFHGPYQRFESEEGFDLITLFQTIEHLDGPMSFLSWAYDHLKPGGRLLIACHDHEAPVNRVMKERSPIFDIEHLQLFSRTALRQGLETAGFDVESLGRYSNTYPLSYWVRLSPLPTRLKNLLRRPGSRVGVVPVRLPVGNLFGVARRR